MFKSPLFWFLLNISCILLQGFFSMMEMACVSFNKVRLQYYLTKNNKKAELVSFFIRTPHFLFGTIMLGVNISLQIGSQSCRESFRYLQINPDFSPFLQIILVTVFGEILPLIIARKIPEKIALKGISFLYTIYFLFYPFIQGLSVLIKLIYKILKVKKGYFNTIINREEFQKILETHHEENDFNMIATNIFSLSKMEARDIMLPLSKCISLPMKSSVKELKQSIMTSLSDFVLIYYTHKKNIIGIASPKQFISKPETDLIGKHMKSPWFISSHSKLINILKEFRENHNNLALVLNNSGIVIGVLSIQAIFNLIFNTPNIAKSKKEQVTSINRTFPGNTKLSELKKQFGFNFPHHDVETLAQLMITLIDEPLEEGLIVHIDNISFQIKEMNLSGIKSVSINSFP